MGFESFPYTRRLRFTALRLHEDWDQVSSLVAVPQGSQNTSFGPEISHTPSCPHNSSFASYSKVQSFATCCLSTFPQTLQQYTTADTLSQRYQHNIT